MKNEIQSITISGRVTRDKLFSAIQPGDIYIYRQDDHNGSRHRHGRHSNYGYSGYFLASVYDGLKWRKLQFNKLIAYESRSYETAKESNQVEGCIAEIVSRWSGCVAHYDSTTRSFRMPMKEVC